MSQSICLYRFCLSHLGLRIHALCLGPKSLHFRLLTCKSTKLPPWEVVQLCNAFACCCVLPLMLFIERVAASPITCRRQVHFFSCVVGQYSLSTCAHYTREIRATVESFSENVSRGVFVLPCSTVLYGNSKYLQFIKPYRTSRCPK